MPLAVHIIKKCHSLARNVVLLSSGSKATNQQQNISRHCTQEQIIFLQRCLLAKPTILCFTKTQHAGQN